MLPRQARDKHRENQHSKKRDDVFFLQLLEDPHTISGLGDAGAHVGTICDGSYPTFLITHWCEAKTPRFNLLGGRFDLFSNENDLFCQDRLGTNIVKR
jgi:N-acyl-D-aspartate/D-glutamate deacylase